MKPWQKLLVAGASAAMVATSMGGYYEGMRTHAYQDAGGVWTICYGHTGGVKPGDVATPAECHRWHIQDEAAHQAAVQRCIRRPMTTGQLSAFTDAAYNAGDSAFCHSPVARLFNAGKPRKACDYLVHWYIKADGKVLAGLVKRRADERELCLQ